VFENRMLRRVFGPKRDGVTRGWRKLHNEELHDLYSSPSVTSMVKSERRWKGLVARMGRMCIKIGGKPQGKKPLRKPRHRWADSTKLGHNREEWRVVVNTVTAVMVPNIVGS
jgi:hypothetical protein